MIVCLYDGCCKFEPSQHNHVYCNEHKCKRKEENRKRRLETPLIYDEDTFELQENRKRALLARRDARNTWVFDNKSFAMFDLETTDLKADGGQILCASIKPLDGHIETFKSDIYLPEGGDDHSVLIKIRDRLREFDYVVTWYGTGFDMPFLKTRLLLNNLESLGEIYHYDLYYTSRFHFLFNSNRMQSVEEALFQGKTHKTRLSRVLWAKAQSFNYKERIEALDYIADHCEMDVISLEEIFYKIGEAKDVSSIQLRRY